MKKNLLSIVILALLLVNIGLTAVMMISVTTTNSKTAALIDNIATVMNLELTTGSEDSAVTQISLADTEIYEISDSMTIPLKIEVDENGEKKKQVYMVCNISLQINKNHEDYAKYGASVSSYESLIKDAIRTVISSKLEDECKGDNQEILKKEILKAVQDVFGSDFIYGIAISEYKFG